MGISIQNEAMYSLGCPHPGNTGTAGDWNQLGDVELLKKMNADFCPVVRKLLTKVLPEDLLVWKMNQFPELSSWVFGSGKVVLLGDGMCSSEEISWGLRLSMPTRWIDSCTHSPAVFWAGEFRYGSSRYRSLVTHISDISSHKVTQWPLKTASALLNV